MPDYDFVPQTRKDALELGAALIEKEVGVARAKAREQDAADGGKTREHLVLHVMHTAQCAATLREMARGEES